MPMTTATLPYEPRLYQTNLFAKPLNGPESLDAAAVAAYLKDGYLTVNGFYTPEEVAAGIQGLSDLIMGKNPEFKHIQFEPRLKPEAIEKMSLEEREYAVRKLMYFGPYDARLNAMATHPVLMSAMEKILGEPAKCVQEMALLKPPMGQEKPWHQDKAYFNYALETRVVGVWIALDEATVENGCMHVLPGGHAQGAIYHYPVRDWQICDRDIYEKKIVACPLTPGGLLLFDGLMPHGTPINLSNKRRRALQFHYIAQSVQKIPQEVRVKIYGGKEQGMEC
jgi:phytanoyl-CoA hydroxylase